MSLVSPAQAEAPLILAIDIGSSSIRALLFDRHARLLEGSETRRRFELTVEADGMVEADPPTLLEGVYGCIDQLLEQNTTLTADIGAVAIDTFVSNLMAVDEEDRPLTPLFTYADTRPAADIPRLREMLDEETVHQRTGCHYHPSYLPVRFLWLQRTRPDLLRPGVRWMSFGEYLALQLFGQTAASYTVASWTGLLNRHRLEWDEALLEALPLEPEALSPLVDIDQPWQGLRSKFARRWPSLRDVSWFPAVGDGAAANVGSGCISPAQLAVTTGSTSALRVVMEGSGPQHIPNGLWCYRLDRHRSLLGGALSEGGNVFDWIRRSLQMEERPELDGELASRPPDGHGLTFLPLLAGERSPGWAGFMRGTLHGISLATTPQDILQAGLEGVAYRIAAVYRPLRSALPAEPQVIASGGAFMHSPFWVRLVADVLARPLQVSQAPEATARGAALLALVAMDALPDLESASYPLSVLQTPDMERHPIYEKAMQRQSALYEILLANRRQLSLGE